jgi:formiminotetrahydrofolate cyclodeaminase
MAEVNLGMVDDQEEVSRIANELEELYAQAQVQSREIVAHTRSIIR